MRAVLAGELVGNLATSDVERRGDRARKLRRRPTKRGGAAHADDRESGAERQALRRGNPGPKAREEPRSDVDDDAVEPGEGHSARVEHESDRRAEQLGVAPGARGLEACGSDVVTDERDGELGGRALDGERDHELASSLTAASSPAPPSSASSRSLRSDHADGLISRRASLLWPPSASESERCS